MIGEDESHHMGLYNHNTMLACNGVISIVQPLPHTQEFSYLTAMTVYFGNVCGPKGAKIR